MFVADAALENFSISVKDDAASRYLVPECGGALWGRAIERTQIHAWAVR